MPSRLPRHARVGCESGTARVRPKSGPVELFFDLVYVLAITQLADHLLGHMAHRCFLFIILALGQWILITGANFANRPASAGGVAPFVVAFVASATLWWIYFDRQAGAVCR